MDPAYEAYSPPRPTSPSRNKVIIQRQYREKEAECFSTLREVIKDLTGEELQTRQEILRKATDLLLTVLQARRQSETQVIPSGTQVGISPLPNHFAGIGSAQSPLWPQTWQFDAKFEAGDDHTAQPQDQQDHSTFHVDSGFVHATYGEDPFNCPRR